MKKLLCLFVSILLIWAMFAGCSKEENDSSKKDKEKDDDLITIIVNNEYADSFADDYAKEVKSRFFYTKYTFEEADYTEFLKDFHEVVKEESREALSTPHQYTHYNLNAPEIVVGLGESEYEQIGEEELKAEAQILGEATFKYQMYLENPATTIPVTYREATTSDEYFTVECEMPN